MDPGRARIERRIRWLLLVVIAGLVCSGLTAFPLRGELRLLTGALSWLPQGSGLLRWLTFVREGLEASARDFPFMAYGTDWLAFAHLVIAFTFVGPLRDPWRNAWVIDVGLVACAGVPVIALVAGPLRGIPLPWRLLDCSFGVLCSMPLLACRRAIARLPAPQS